MMRKHVCLLLPLLLPLLAHAHAPNSCEQTGLTQTADHKAAPIRFGNVTLASPHLQPPGTLLASTVVPPTDYGYSAANADSILWRCDAHLLPQLHFLVSTNGDSRFGGHNEIGKPDGLSDVYATWFKHVGLRLSMDGVPVSRIWHAVPLRHYDRVKQGARDLILIRLKHLPALHAELYRVSAEVPNRGASATCGGVQRAPNAQGIAYACKVANAYISLAGPGLQHDQVGEDANERYVHWWHNNGFAYRLYQGSTLFQRASCAVRHSTPHVVFPTQTRAWLQAGGEVAVPFSVQVECDAAVAARYTQAHTVPRKRVTSGQVSIGIQVSPGAWQAAQILGLVNSEGGVRALVSDHYGQDPGLAQGVGIKLQSSSGQDLLFAGQANHLPAAAGNEASASNSGWYPVLQEAERLGPAAGAAPGTAKPSEPIFYQQNLTAVLHRLPGQTVTTGRIHATAYVMIKVQ